MKDNIILYVFTDPMMGLSYENEPILNRLECEYRDTLVIRYIMRVLVRDVSDFMTPEERSLAPATGICRYNSRLAEIYKSEEQLGGLPINMEGFCLFDPAHRSSRPLCLAYKAVQLTAPDKADVFLTALRHATVLECRPTTHFDEIRRVVRTCEIDEVAFTEAFHNGSAEAALMEDSRFAQRFGIRSLPSYVFQHQDRALLLQSFQFSDFADAITLLLRDR